MADAVIGSAYLQVIPKMPTGELTKVSAASGTEAGEAFGGTFGSALGSAGTIASKALAGVKIAAGSAAAATAVVAKGTFDAYSNYEQLSGGMDKLFGDSASTVMANADKAFMTAGKSANEYMEGVTSIAASLVKSVGGDTAEAARLADVAMTAMSDNANTFGTDAQSVQAAVTGLAKGNYSMLDNLSLGFAGTQQGMVDLINASGVLDHELTDTSELADVGFGTMVEAIQAVQENMGIAGTTAKEAMGTIEGSMTAAKSAWENVLTSIGSGDSQKLASAATGLVDAVFGVIDTETGKREGGVIENVTALAQRAFETLGGLLPGLASQALDVLPESISEPIRSIVADVQEIFADLDIEGTLGAAFEAAGPIVETALSGILGVLSIVVRGVKVGVKAIRAAMDGFGPMVAKVKGIFNRVKEAITHPIDTARNLIKSAIDKIKHIIGGVKLQLPHINLPHFSVSGGKAPWGIGGKGSMPSFSVKWYAQGGYFDQPTLFAGVGERGGEFVWPSYAPYLDRYADALAERIDGGGVNVYLTYNGTGDADELVRTLTRDLRMLRATGAI